MKLTPANQLERPLLYYETRKIVIKSSSSENRFMFDEPSVALVGIVPVLVVEIVPARPLPKDSAEPDRVVDIVPALVVEMVPALVVEMVPVFAADVVDTVRIKVAVQAIHLSFVIAFAP